MSEGNNIRLAVASQQLAMTTTRTIRPIPSSVQQSLSSRYYIVGILFFFRRKKKPKGLYHGDIRRLLINSDWISPCVPILLAATGRVATLCLDLPCCNLRVSTHQIALGQRWGVFCSVEILLSFGLSSLSRSAPRVEHKILGLLIFAVRAYMAQASACIS